MDLPDDEKTLKCVMRIQSIARTWLTLRDLEKGVKRHVYRTKIARELFDTEVSYLRDLMILQDFNTVTEGTLSKEEREILFSNVEEIKGIHTVIAQEIEERIKRWGFHATIADVFFEHMKDFKNYRTYINNHDKALTFLSEKRLPGSALDKLLITKEKSPLCRSLKLESFMTVPVQRLPRYSLLLKELLKYTGTDHKDYDNIKQAILKFDQINVYLNESRRVSESTHKIEAMKKEIEDLDIGSLGTKLFLYEGELFYKSENEKVDLMLMLTISVAELEVKMKEKRKEAQSKEFKPVRLYMFTDSLLFAKKIGPKTILDSISETLFSSSKSPSWYKFSAMKSIPLSDSVQLELSKTDPTQFTLTNLSDFSVYAFQAPSALSRDTWVMHFKKTSVQFV